MIKKECIIKSKSNYGTNSITKFSLLHSNKKELEDAVYIEVHTVIPSNDLLEQYQKRGYVIMAEENHLIGKKVFGIKISTLLKGLKNIDIKK